MEPSKELYEKFKQFVAQADIPIQVQPFQLWCAWWRQMEPTSKADLYRKIELGWDRVVDETRIKYRDTRSMESIVEDLVKELEAESDRRKEWELNR